jgi:GT2 family glycosyltransferase
MTDVPFVSILIPTHQRCDSLRRALISLAMQSTAPETYELVIAVDSATDGTQEMLRKFTAPCRLRVTTSLRRGRAAACNAALELARGEVIIILDDDMQVVAEFVERHRRHHAPHSRLCVLGSVPVEVDSSSPLAARYVQTKFDAHLSRLANPLHVYVPRDFYSGNVSLRAEVLRGVGGFDDSFTAYGNEDVDLWVRLRAAGVEFHFDREALARQRYEKDFHALARDNVAKGRTAVMLSRIHPEVLPELRLANPRDGSSAWRSLRAILLGLTRRFRRSAAAVFVAASLLEHAGAWRSPLFYRAVLDYAFWVGVDAELESRSVPLELAHIGVELHRGAIDLLLHG